MTFLAADKPNNFTSISNVAYIKLNFGVFVVSKNIKCKNALKQDLLTSILKLPELKQFSKVTKMSK